jgi:hypothetical protein
MSRGNLEEIAALLAASDGPSLPDGECIDLIWAYLRDTCGIDPDDYRAINGGQ